MFDRGDKKAPCPPLDPPMSGEVGSTRSKEPRLLLKSIEITIVSLSHSVQHESDVTKK